MKKAMMTRKGKELSYNLVIDAPVDLVYEIRTDPRLVHRYFRTEDLKTKSFQSDLRIGGRLKLVLVDSRGKERVSEGMFLEVVPKSMVRYELETSAIPGKMLIVDEWLTDKGEKTDYNVRISFEEESDLYSAMDTGWHLSWVEYVTRFGRLVEAVHNEQKVPDIEAAI